MNVYRFLLLILFSCISNLYSQSYNGFTADEVHNIHQKWNLENWDNGGELSRYLFLNTSEFWTHAIISRHGKVKDLKENFRKEIAAFKIQTESGEMSLQEYVDSSKKVDGMIILQGDNIVYEAYPRMLKQDKHLSWSVSKVFTSTLIAILEDRKLLEVSKTIDHYIPELKESGWEQVPIIDILDMASGIDCLEWVEGAYENPETCCYQFEAALGLLERTDKTAINAFEHIKTLASGKTPGKNFEYASVNTFVLACLVEKVTGRTYAENIEREIWQKIGAESDALIMQTKGTSVSHAGISSNLRDLARFGYMFLAEGRSTENAFVSEEYLDKIQKGGRPHLISVSGSENNIFDKKEVLHNTYQWDMVMKDGDFFKSGFSGQGLYISPAQNLVIAFFGTADEQGVANKLDEVSRQLSKSGLFNKK